MSQDQTPQVDIAEPKPELPPAAQRALAEAAERRAVMEAEAKSRAKEYGGRDGPEPVRYGDWESKGLAIDF
ncbi:DUF1674 domain-containing protein [Pseudooceanicola sediminis]|uniref:DUF1674 domain-containing protein n=1 Tax=Pseudooceanicola sediminis TaxID=2211117 RepID=A0A399IZ62_9RHOB|nr:DUF1674 domain-containing protein [Pseudooceanicola sediminis]KAA2313411.1 DUF1674 domain-containing protein [Puniceibacterium sp. HSS470]RII38311.1 DUF1674 domain-containing protein [Pseudooceanicola sediminis]|tara:strand:- start:68753 stop:68965 length:213 start_codon:yes stop_codon:yes gene_type:complete